MKLIKNNKVSHPDFLSLNIDSNGSLNLEILTNKYNMDKDLSRSILYKLIDLTLLGDEDKQLIELSDDILVNINPVGGIDSNDFFLVTNHLRQLLESLRREFENLGLMVYGIPPYEFFDHFNNETFILRKVKNIDY